jgi:glycine/D-amino acid oxidase-like deaminating enzyme
MVIMTHNDIITEQISTPVKYECDVCVAGGGVAGIAAALSAARAAKKTGKEPKVILLEKGFMLGGLATAGLVTIYLPICDGLGNQVCFGLGEELLRLSIEHGAEDKYPLMLST